MSKQNSPMTKNESKRASEKLTSLKIMSGKTRSLFKIKQNKKFRAKW
jgi:hypothetical protein